MLLVEGVEQAQIFVLVVGEEVAEACVSLEEGTRVFEKHFCPEFPEDSLLDLVPHQIPVRPAQFIAVEDVRPLQVLRETGGGEQVLGLHVIVLARLVYDLVFKVLFGV